MTPENRQSLANAIYLCATCADLIDKKGGFDYPQELLHRWRTEHEKWVAQNLNKPMDREERPRLEPEYFFYGREDGQASLGILLHAVGELPATDVTLEVRIEPRLRDIPSPGRARWDRIAPPMVGDNECLIPGLVMNQIPAESQIVTKLEYKDPDGRQWTTNVQETVKQAIDRSKEVHSLH